jgi:hypothetical protein
MRIFVKMRSQVKTPRPSEDSALELYEAFVIDDVVLDVLALEPGMSLLHAKCQVPRLVNTNPCPPDFYSVPPRVSQG